MKMMQRFVRCLSIRSLVVCLILRSALPSEAVASQSPLSLLTRNRNLISSAKPEKPPLQDLLRTLFDPVVGWYKPEVKRSDLGFGNFFTYGWTEGWSEPEEGPNDAPRFRLLRIQRAFWERELRLTYSFAFRPDARGNDEQEGEFELELPISRRFLIEFESGVAATRRTGRSWIAQGSDLRIIPEVTLVETRRLSFSTGLIVETPTGSSSRAGADESDALSRVVGRLGP
jgi:hypothetical protein